MNDIHDTFDIVFSLFNLLILFQFPSDFILTNPKLLSTRWSQKAEIESFSKNIKSFDVSYVNFHFK